MHQKFFAAFVDIVRGSRIEASLVSINLRSLAVLPYASADSVGHQVLICASTRAQVSY